MTVCVCTCRGGVMALITVGITQMNSTVVRSRAVLIFITIASKIVCTLYRNFLLITTSFDVYFWGFDVNHHMEQWNKILNCLRDMETFASKCRLVRLLLTCPDLHLQRPTKLFPPVGRMSSCASTANASAPTCAATSSMIVKTLDLTRSSAKQVPPL